MSRVRFQQTESSRQKSRSPLPSPDRRGQQGNAATLLEDDDENEEGGHHVSRSVVDAGPASAITGKNDVKSPTSTTPRTKMNQNKASKTKASISDLLEEISAAKRPSALSKTKSTTLPKLEDALPPRDPLKNFSRKDLQNLQLRITENVKQSQLEKNWKQSDKIGKFFIDPAINSLFLPVGREETTWEIERKMHARRSTRSYRELPDDGRRRLRLHYFDKKEEYTKLRREKTVSEHVFTKEEVRRRAILEKDLMRKQHPLYVNKMRQLTYDNAVAKEKYLQAIAAEEAEQEARLQGEAEFELLQGARKEVLAKQATAASLEGNEQQALAGNPNLDGPGGSAAGSGVKKQGTAVGTGTGSQVHDERTEMQMNERKSNRSSVTNSRPTSPSPGEEKNRKTTQSKIKPPKLLPLPNSSTAAVPNTQIKNYWKTVDMSTRGNSFEEKYPWKAKEEKRDLYQDGFYEKQVKLVNNLDARKQGGLHKDNHAAAPGSNKTKL
ncbi:unnamed protein product [Amoebophrya sp. A120]|nr:unnamed protein product [Amoebophrya sp. A120]|eukprot:GSA120T00019176001.1